MLAVGIALVAAFAAAPAQAKTSIYVGVGPEYFAAFKIEDGRPYVLAVDAHIYCRGTGTHSDQREGEGTAERFPAPVRMRPTPEGLRGVDELRGRLETESVVVRARIRRGRVVGTIVATHGGYEFRCKTGGYFGDREIPFEAVRYVPVGSPRASHYGDRSAAGRIYFTHAGPLEVFLHRLGPRVVDIRGAARQRCPLPASESHPPRVPLFSLIAGGEIGDRGGFREHWHQYGPARRHATFNESITLTGKLKNKFAVGSYSRVKVKKRGERIIRRCETGPVSYRAVRYVPVR